MSHLGKFPPHIPNTSQGSTRTVDRIDPLESGGSIKLKKKTRKEEDKEGFGRKGWRFVTGKYLWLFHLCLFKLYVLR